MNPILIFLICFGLSLNLYAAVVCKGALLPSIRKNDLIYYSFVFAVWQLITLSLGNIIAVFLSIAGFTREGQPIDRLLAVVIFVCIAFRMLKAAWKRETILEKRLDCLNGRAVMVVCMQYGFYTFFAGIAFGLFRARLWQVLGMLVGITVFMVPLGFYAGYRFGYEMKDKVYLLGGGCVLGGALYLWGRMFLGG